MMADSEDPAPDLLAGYHDAGQALEAAIRQARSILTLAPGVGPPARFRDLGVHTQYRKQYASRAERQRILQATSTVLDETVFDTTDPEKNQRFDEALAALREVEESVFVAVFRGNIWSLVFWDWRFAYAIDEWNASRGRRRFRRDWKARRVASPAGAAQRYGGAIARWGQAGGDE